MKKLVLLALAVLALSAVFPPADAYAQGPIKSVLEVDPNPFVADAVQADPIQIMQMLWLMKFALGPLIGIDEDGDVFLGVVATYALAQIGKHLLLARPSFDYYPFIDNLTLWALNLEVAFVFALTNARRLAPYAGGGLSVGHISADFFGSDTDVNVILRGGLLYALTASILLDPNIHLLVGDGSFLGLSLALRFLFGGGS